MRPPRCPRPQNSDALSWPTSRFTPLKSKQYVSAAETSWAVKRRLFNVSGVKSLDYSCVTAGNDSISRLKKFHETGDKTATKVFETSLVSLSTVHNKTEASDIPPF